MVRRIIAPFLFSLALLVQVSPSRLRAWDLDSGSLVPTALPVGSAPLSPVLQADFDGDGLPERLTLSGGQASLLSGGKIVWQSPSTWQVVQAGITDLDHDGAPEATLLVWRPFQPWPVDRWLPSGGRIDSYQDARGDSCQLILVGWVHGGYQEVWAGSAMAEPVKAFVAADLTGDGNQELVTLEGSYADSRSAPARALKIWEWNSFGFTVVSIIEGTFDELALVRAGNGHILILVP